MEKSEVKLQRLLILAESKKNDDPKSAYNLYRLSINAATGVINDCLSLMDECMYSIEALKENEK